MWSITNTVVQWYGYSVGHVDNGFKLGELEGRGISGDVIRSHDAPAEGVAELKAF